MELESSFEDTTFSRNLLLERYYFLLLKIRKNWDESEYQEWCWIERTLFKSLYIDEV
ncbi:hypothetical protein [Sphingobacterium psychroaquaticum]|uniref:hypothetical protein n=1 Tax=Sphingobacterium psychroaquaticum TaxID=561061 RepID=UPI0013566395|nr:hypothetical protein [Sphingobacterium psychroaquaticum]